MANLITRRPSTAVQAPQPPDPVLTRTLAEFCSVCPGHCCRNDMIPLYPDKGDDPATFETVEAISPVNGDVVLILTHKPNGDCTYLTQVDGAGRCSIYDRRPAICRAFDCGLAFAKLSRTERRFQLRAGVASRETLDQGRRVQAARKAKP